MGVTQSADERPELSYTATPYSPLFLNALPMNTGCSASLSVALRTARLSTSAGTGASDR